MLRGSSVAVILSLGYAGGPLHAADFKEQNEKALLNIASQIESIKSVARTEFETEEQFQLRRKSAEEKSDKTELTFELKIPYRGINDSTYEDQKGAVFYSPHISSFIFTMPVGIIDFLYNNKVINTYSGSNSYGANTQVQELETYNYYLDLTVNSERYLSNYLRYEGGEVVASYLKKPNDPAVKFDRNKSIINGDKCTGNQGQCIFGVVFKNANGDDQSLAKNIAVKLIMKIDKSKTSYTYEYKGRLNSPTFKNPTVYIPVERRFKTYIEKVVFFNTQNGQILLEKKIELDDETLKLLEKKKSDEYESRFVKPTKERKFDAKKYGVHSGSAEFELNLLDRQEGRYYFEWDTKTFDNVAKSTLIKMSCSDKDGKKIECSDVFKNAVLLHLKELGFKSVKENVLYRMNF